MEIRMAYPNEINRIMEIIQDGKDSLAAAGVVLPSQIILMGETEFVVGFS